MRLLPSVWVGALISVLLAGCGEQSAESESAGERSSVEITAIYEASSGRHLFQTSADTVQAGWTTFRFTNASPMLHFVLLDHLPGTRTSNELLSEVSPIFQESMNLIMAGKSEEAAAQFANLPEWFGEIVFRGGPGFLSPGLSTETTLYLEPGNYVLECYIKTADGVFHWNLGMFADLHVTDEATDAGPPVHSTLTVTVTDSALIMEGDPTPGEHLVAVDFREEEPGLVGKDVHVVRLDPGSDLDEIVAWMDFNRVEGLVSTPESPAPAVFVGGTQDMPFGNTAYFTLTLEPGEYLFVSEQPTAESVYHRFRIQ
jgi:hypothetical protein